MLCTDSVYLCIFLDGEKLTSGELQEFIRKVIDSGTLQEAGSEVTSQSPKDRLRSVMSISSPAIEKFLSELSEGMYDSPHPKTKVVNAAPVIMELDVQIWEWLRMSWLLSRDFVGCFCYFEATIRSKPVKLP